MSDVSFDFTGRTVIVTGAAQGIGRAIAELFHSSGARVAPWDRDADLLHQVWSRSGDRVAPMAVDVADAVAVSRATDRVADWGGGVDVVVNNAGVTRDSVVWKLAPEDWSTVLRVHLDGTFHLTRSAIGHMRSKGFGRVINVTSYSGLHGNIGQSNYAAAKAGIVGFTKTVAKEVGRFGITVNAVSPNAATAMVAQVPHDKLAEMTNAIPLGRFAQAEEIAPAVAFLATGAAGYITGAVVTVDGGMSM
jgi:3-oxoacyl-[acyl-carrier protein] reductase